MQITFTRHEAKNQLVKSRNGGGGFGFEDFVEAFRAGKILAKGTSISSIHTNQYFFAVEIDGYSFKAIYRVVTSTVYHLITMFPCSDYKHLL